MDHPALSAVGLVRRFGRRAAVDDITEAVQPGELLAVLGPSGSGKTTLLRLIAGFEVPDAGSIAIAGVPVAGNGTWVEPERRGIGLLPQGDSLFPHLTVGENVAFGVRRNRARVREVLELVGLADRADSDPRELSGGERQRVALARALAPRPALMLLDEPFSALDTELRVRLRADIAGVLRHAQTTTVWVTHDQEEALATADRVLLLRDGHAVQCGTPTTIYWEPADLWAARFLGDLNIVPADWSGAAVRTPLGPFAVSNNAHHGTPQVGIRPEAIALESAADGAGTITSREFRGRDILYHVTDPTNGELSVRTAPFQVFDVGQAVHIVPAPGAQAIALPPRRLARRGWGAAQRPSRAADATGGDAADGGTASLSLDVLDADSSRNRSPFRYR